MGDSGFEKLVLRKYPLALIKEVKEGKFHVVENERPNARIFGHGNNEIAAWKSAAEYSIESCKERAAMSWEAG